MAGVGRAGRLERGHRAGFGDALLEDLAVGRLAVAEHEVGVDRLVALAEGGIDADLLEQRVHAERAGLVRDDRHDARAELLVADEVAQDRVKTIVVDTAVWLPAENSESIDSAGPAGRPHRGADRPVELAPALWMYWTSSESGTGW